MGLNDTAWETLFVRHNILDEISKAGLFRITADQIKAEREPRPVSYTHLRAHET